MGCESELRCLVKLLLAADFYLQTSANNDYDCNEKAEKRETELIPLLACSKPYHRFQSLRVKRRS